MKPWTRTAAVLASLALTDAAHAQTSYPARSVRVIVPFAAGGPTDVIARIVADKLSERWGQQFYIENIPGAGGNTGTAMVAKAPADGYTLLVVSTGFMVNPSLYAKGVPYDPIKDFRPLSLVAASPNVLFVNPSVSAKTPKELIALVQANPGKYSYAQPATGSTPHLAGELFKLTYKLDLVMVPFNGAPLAVNSTIGGHTPIAFTALPPAMSNIRDGKVRGLAILSPKRVAALPDLPTMAESGIPDQESDTLTGIVVAAATPQPIVDQLYQEIAKIGALPAVQERLQTLGFNPVVSTPDAFGARIKAEMTRWDKVIRDAHLKIE